MKKILITLMLLTSFSANAQEPLDLYYTAEEMAKSRAMLKKMTGGQNHLFVLADRFEYQTADDGALAWEVQGWYGGDQNKIWFKSEAEYEFEEKKFEEGNVELLYSRAIAPYFDFQAGVKQDFNAGPRRTYATVGILGLAPYWFEVDGSLQVSNKGDISANFEVEYELLLSQRIILQPLVELIFNFQDVPELGIGAGLSNFEVGLRLRYEIKREFAPYIGVSWGKSLGDNANFAREHDHNASKTTFVAGIRAWY